jgi:hypothetical protein
VNTLRWLGEPVTEHRVIERQFHLVRDEGTVPGSYGCQLGSSDRFRSFCWGTAAVAISGQIANYCSAVGSPAHHRSRPSRSMARTTASELPSRSTVVTTRTRWR